MVASGPHDDFSPFKVEVAGSVHRLEVVKLPFEVRRHIKRAEMKLNPLLRRLQFNELRRLVPRRVFEKGLLRFGHHPFFRRTAENPLFNEGELTVGEVRFSEGHERPVMGVI